MKKVYIETYGCQMNVADTEVVFAILAAHGYERTEDISSADVIMANTCSIRENAEQRIRGRLDFFAGYRKARPGVYVGILGCMAERLKDELLEVHVVVEDLAGIVEDAAFGTLYDLLKALALEWSACYGSVEVVDVGLEVFSVMESDGFGAEHRLQCIGRIGECNQFEHSVQI